MGPCNICRPHGCSATFFWKCFIGFSKMQYMDSTGNCLSKCILLSLKTYDKKHFLNKLLKLRGSRHPQPTVSISIVLWRKNVVASTSTTNIDSLRPHNICRFLYRKTVLQCDLDLLTPFNTITMGDTCRATTTLYPVVVFFLSFLSSSISCRTMYSSSV